MHIFFILGQLYDDNCKILLDLKKLYVVKDKDLILEGMRHLQDGLWDISLHNHNLYNAPCQLTLVHPSIYPNTFFVAHTSSTLSSMPPPLSKPSDFNAAFCEIDNIIDLNECSYEKKQQRKQDRPDAYSEIFNRHIIAQE